MLGLAALLASLIGLTLGMLGGGGSILALPMLVYVLDVDAKAAVAMSLLVVGTTSVVAMAAHARRGAVRVRTGLSFGAAAMVGAFLGGRAAAFVPGAALLVVFGVVMVVTSVAMLRRRDAGGDEAGAPVKARLAHALVLGGTVGALSGLVGAGGGFLIVPALTLFGGLGMREAVGTSLLVITLQSFAGFAGHLGHAELDTTLLTVVTLASVAGTLVGVRIGRTMPVARLRRTFAWFVLAMGILLFVKELSFAFAIGAVALSVLSVIVALYGPGRRRALSASEAGTRS